MTKVYTIYDNFLHIGGAEKIALNIHNSFKEKGVESQLIARNRFELNNLFYKINPDEYLQSTLANILKIKGSVVISHHRKMTTIIIVLNVLFKLKIRIIHVAHNEFTNLRFFTLFPSEIIAVSQKVKTNLIDYFKISPEKITVIYNGIVDSCKKVNNTRTETSKNFIKILYLARITGVKRQVQIVDRLKGNLCTNILIHFAGIGDMEEVLKNRVKDDSNFKYIGFINLDEKILEYDYVMLFSEKEGLPLSFIEAISYSKPIICNDVGGNLEIVKDKYNGFVVNSYEDLINCLNNLKDIDKIDYYQLAQNSRKMFLDKFNEDKMLEKYFNLITDKKYEIS